MQQPRGALDFLNQARMIVETLADKALRAMNLSNIGFSYSLLNQLVEAKDNYQQALASYRELGDSSGEADVLKKMDSLVSMRRREHE